MFVIHAYELEIADEVELDMPAWAEPISVIWRQRDQKLILYAKVDPARDMVIHLFHVVGTGNPITAQLGHFIGTVECNPFVWHVFEAG